MKVNTQDIGGEIIRDTDVYQVIDNTLLNNLTLSKTILHPHQKTSGHSHPGLEEVYFFVSGDGRMKIDRGNVVSFLKVKAGDIVLIPDGAYHRVYNDMTDEDLEFVCVFQKYER
jgi:oxalate decarboxylase/phosphoglucose isomerase-like protein (cupin superfamily)